ncbi:MAG: aminotransferase class IV [Trueperaceae bacterium]|nr:MAG: aminotransferase class IV [Trueperaceae bacterium]
MSYFSINGEIVASQEAKIHVSDLGLRRGYAAFDYFRIVRGKPLFIEDHLDRFENSTRLLGLEIPMSRAELKAHLLELIDRNSVDNAGLQLFLTGGYSPDGFTPVEPNLLVLVNPVSQPKSEVYTTGAKLITHRHQRELPEAKTNNYMMAVSMSRTMKETGAIDVLYHDGHVIRETTRSNIFLVTRGGVLVTPADGMLEGVTRKHILQVVRGHLAVEERDVPVSELSETAEVFITSTTKGAIPVVQVDDITINDGRPGPVTRRVMELFSRHVEAYLQGEG